MLKNVDKDKLIAAISSYYKFQTEVSAIRLAEEYINTIDPIFEEAVQCWLEGLPILNVIIGEYSVNKVLSIRNSTDYLNVLKLLSVYKDDPVLGEKLIWKSIRGCRKK